MIGAPGILGPDGRPVSAERVKLEKQSRFNPLRGWTPDVLVRQLEAFCRGEISALAWVMEWLEKHDDIISTVAPKAKAAVSRWGYDVLPKDEVTPEQKTMAEDQQGVMQRFYQNVETSDAVELEETGGMRLLVQQIMDGYGKGYAAHHIVWKPSRAGLNAELVKVPTWFFEVTTGRMRFLPSQGAARGVDLDGMGGRDAWMISKGRGVMLAGALARMFKQIPLQDWLTYCDRHGMPMFLGKTAAKKGTDGWRDMAAAVAGIGSEYGAVVNTGDAIEVVTLASQGEIPYVKLVDRMDRAQVMLWRGGDLSTISRENGTGSNPQQDDTDDLDGDNALWASEVINRNLTKRVIAWHFGPDVPVLVELKLRTKTRENIAQDLNVVKAAKDMGVRVSQAWFTGKFGIVVAEDGEAALGENAETRKAETLKETDAVNSDGHRPPLQDLAKLLGVREETLAPVAALIDELAAKGGSDEAWRWFVEAAAEELPELFDADDADGFARELEAAMGGAVMEGAREALRAKKSAK